MPTVAARYSALDRPTRVDQEEVEADPEAANSAGNGQAEFVSQRAEEQDIVGAIAGRLSLTHASSPPLRIARRRNRFRLQS